MKRQKNNWPTAIAVTAALAGVIWAGGHLTSRPSLEQTVETTSTSEQVPVTEETQRREEYIVMGGDTAYKICEEYGVTFNNLKLYNPDISDWNSLEVGQMLYLEGE